MLSDASDGVVPAGEQQQQHSLPAGPAARPLMLQNLLAAAVLLAGGGLLLWAASVLTVEHYDGFEYILSAQTMWGDAGYVMPKNPAFISLLTLIHAGTHARGTSSSWPPPLAYYHVPLAVMALLLVPLHGLWVRRRWAAALPVLVAAAVCYSNLYFMMYAPFALSDMTVGLILCVWWRADCGAPLDSHKGRWLRAGALALCALGRPQTVLIPLASLAYQVVRPRDPAQGSGASSRGRRFVAAAQVAIVAAIVYVCGAGLFFQLAQNRPSFFDGVARALGFVRAYYQWIAATAVAPWSEQPLNLWEMLTPVGVLLALFGAAVLYRRRALLPPGLKGTAIGSLCFLLFIIYMRVSGPQYLSVLLPAWILGQCAALAWLNERKRRAGPALATVALALLALSALLPAAKHYTRPLFRQDVDRRTAERLVSWSRSTDMVFLYGFVGKLDQLPPRTPLQDAKENPYFSGFLPFVYYTGVRPNILAPPFTFGRFGFPIPDRIQKLAPAGTTIVVPPMWIDMPDGKILQTPLYALRWSPRGDDASTLPSAASKDPHITDFRVEIFQPTP